MRSFFTTCLLVLASIAYSQTLDPNFKPYITSKVEATGAILFSDGKYLVYGEFVQVNGSNVMGVVKFNADGTVDNTFAIGTGADGNISAAAVQSDGKIVLTGSFTSFNGINRVGLIRLNSDGSIDNTFNPNITVDKYGKSFSLKVQPDGKILISATILSIDGVSTNAFLFRFNTDGTRDTSFTPLFLGPIRDLGFQSDGKIIVVGSFINGIKRLNADGTVDNSFSVGTGFNGTVYDVEVTASDRIICAGNFTQFNGVSYSRMAALTTAGAIDGTFLANGQFDNTVQRIQLTSAGTLLVAGYFTKYGATTVTQLIRLTTTGALDGTMNPGTGPNFSYLDFVATSTTNDILVIGGFTSFNGQSRNGLAILTSTGSVKSISQAMDLQGSDIVYRVVRQGADKILVAHQGQRINGSSSTGFERLNLDGSVDGTFSGNSKPNKYPSAIALDHNGMILIGGQFTTYNSVATSGIARLSSAGVLDNTFTTNTGTGFNNYPTALEEQSDGKILVGGAFTSFNGTARRALTRLNSDGTHDATFNTANGFTTSVGTPDIKDLEVQSDGKILVVGIFDSFDGHSVKNIVRLNVDGSFDASFLIGTGADGQVLTVKILDNGKILIGGNFNNINGNPSPSSAILNSDGSFSTYVSPFSLVYRIEKEANGNLLVADGYSNKGLSRLNADGSIDNTFTPVNAAMSTFDLAFFGTCVIQAGIAPNQTRSGMIKFNLPALQSPSNLAVQSFAASQVALKWTDNSPDDAGFEIYRSTNNNSSYSLIQTTGGNATTFTDTGLTGATTYYYKIRAVNLANASAYSNEISQLTTPADWTGPIAASLAGRSDGVALVINGKAYVGLGKNGTGVLKDWWEFNPSGNVWTQKLDFPGTGRIGAVAFVVNGKGYVGTGNDLGGGALKQDFYEYDPIANTWTPKANFPADATSGAGITAGVAFAIGNYGYVGLGNTGSNNTTAFYRYDPSTNSWQARANFAGGGRTGAIGFATNGLGFVGLGFGSLAPNLNDLWQYDPTADQWTAKTSYSGNGRGGAAATTINGDAFVFAGTENTTGTFGADVRVKTSTSYSTITNTWTDQLPMPASASARTGAVAFSINKVAYVFGGYTYSSGNVYLADFYSYSPSSTFLPLAPSSAATSLLSQTSVQCTWIDNSDNETGFVIEYAVGNNSTYTTAGTVGSGVTTFNATGLTADTQYTFRIRAYGAYGNSLPSNPAAIVTTFPPAAPTNLNAQFVATVSITLTWTDNATNETGFEIYRSAATNGAYTLITSIAPNSTTYTDNGLTTGTSYFYKVRAVNAGGGSAYSNEANPPSSATNLLAVLSTSQAVLTWTDNSNNETGFEIYRSSPSNASYALVATTAPNATTFTDNGITPSTKYYYKIRAVNVGGASTYSNEVTPPFAPSNLAIQSFAANQIVIQWADNSNNETAFEIYRSSPLNTNYVLLTTVVPNMTTFVNTVLTASTTYFYKIRAINAGGASTYSNEISQTTLPSPPAGPTGFSVQFLTSTQAMLQWTDNSTNETGFEIYRSSPSNTSYTLIQTTAADITTFTDSGLAPSTVYYYKIRAINTGGPSGYTNEVAPPLAPSNLQAQLSAQQIVLTWIDNSSTETGFEVYRSVGTNNSYSLVQLISANLTTMPDVNISPGTTYFYKVRAVNINGYSNYSNEVSQTTPVLIPSAPTNLAVQSVTASQGVITWKDNSTNETGFEIYRSTSTNLNYSLLQTTAADATSFTDNNLSPSTIYFYKLRAVNSGGSSPYSNEISATTLPTIPAVPSGLQVKWETATRLTLSWTDNSTNEAGFEVYKSAGNNANYSLVQTTASNAISYTDNSVLAGNTYFYKIRSVNQGGNSAFTDELVTVITGIEESASASFAVYPNPSSVEFAIDNNTGSDLKFNVYNSLGELIVADEIAPNAKRSVNCGSWNSGVYILQVPQLKASYKVIKE